LVEDSMETAPISALDRLQELVHEVLRERLAATRDGIDVMWLDGHFVIGADSERPYPVAAQWFGGLGLDALVICMAAPAVIRARRKLDRTRGRVLADIGQIAAAQARELRHGSLLATALGLPLVEAWPDGTCRLHPEARGAATPCW
jgi:adenylate kinase